MQSFQYKITDKLASKYRDDAISAGSDYAVDLTNVGNLLDNLDSLCVKLNSEIEEILSDEILLDSIAIKNAAIVYLYLKDNYPDKDIGWYRHDAYYGVNTYPVKFGSLAVFPKQWFKDAIVSGKPGYFKDLYKSNVVDGSSELASEVSEVDDTEIKRLLTQAHKLIPKLPADPEKGVTLIESYINTTLISATAENYKTNTVKLGLVLGEYIKNSLPEYDKYRWHYGKTAVGGDTTYYLVASDGAEFYPIDWIVKYSLKPEDSIAKKYKKWLRSSTGHDDRGVKKVFNFFK